MSTCIHNQIARESINDPYTCTLCQIEMTVSIKRSQASDSDSITEKQLSFLNRLLDKTGMDLQAAIELTMENNNSLTEPEAACIDDYGLLSKKFASKMIDTLLKQDPDYQPKKSNRRSNNYGSDDNGAF